MDVFYGTLCAQGLTRTREEFGSRCDRFFGQEEPAPAADGLTVFERRIRRVLQSVDLSLEQPTLRAMAANMVNSWQAHVTLDPEALGVLKELRTSKTLALITNFDHPPHALRVLRETGLDAYFSSIVISGDVGVKKPDPAIFQIALQATGLAPDEVVYVGDTMEDVKGATAAGIRPIIIARLADPSRPRILDYTRGQESPSDRATPHEFADVTNIASLREIITAVSV
jgi:HAD superfamily hydrolase (TIGR01549 family)